MLTLLRGCKAVLRFSCVLLAAFLPATRAAAVDRGTPRRESSASIAAIVVPESLPWLAPLAAAGAQRLARGGRLPLVVIAGEPFNPAGQMLLSRAAARPDDRIVVLRGEEDRVDLPPSLRSICEEVRLDGDELESSLRWAGRVWKTSRDVVCAQRDDPAGIILAGALAARWAKPLLILPNVEAESLARIARELGAQRAVIAAWPGRNDRQQCSGIAKIEILDRRALQQRLTGLARPEGIRTIVLARVPESDRRMGATAWLAPWVALARGGLVELCRSSGATNAENRVEEVVQRLQLHPRSVTILADYESIGTHLARIRDIEEDATIYKVGTEPCAPHDLDQIGHRAVGRIPFSSLGDASTLFAAGLVRERQVQAPPRVLMIANPGPEEMQLPLCEAISRLTAQEYKNCGLQVDEFYRVPASSPEPRAAAQRAHLIVYQGHIEHQELFPDPRRKAKQLAAGQSAAENEPLALQELPVVVLQTCQSARGLGFLQMVHDAGGVGLIGTATEVHSASGSALTKAMTNGWLYGGCTLGESLRDAQNYFSCLVELKTRRGHQQQFKTERAAIAFRLWGDPELRVFVEPPRAVQPPVAARLEGLDRVVLNVPQTRLPEVRSEGYSAAMFPGCVAAGIVIPGEPGSLRKVVPLYYSRLQLPEEHPWLKAPPAAVTAGDRLAFRVDPAGRFLYVLWFPSRERAGQPWALSLSGELRWRASQ